MSDTQTKGPWVVEYVEGGGYDTLSSAYRIKYGEDSRRERVCEVDTRDYDDRIETDDFGVETSADAEANAHLIAAAPELLAACQALMETHHGYHLGAGPCICHAHEAAKAAIAKAEGRS